MFSLRSISGKIEAKSVTVSTTATAISTTLSNGRTKLIFNNGSQTVYLGASGVTVADGYPLVPGDEKGFDCEVAIYGITESSSSDIRIFEGE